MSKAYPTITLFVTVSYLARLLYCCILRKNAENALILSLSTSYDTNLSPTMNEMAHGQDHLM